jgi:hypothetical protein
MRTTLIVGVDQIAQAMTSKCSEQWRPKDNI